jgi:hypothetical protein
MTALPKYSAVGTSPIPVDCESSEYDGDSVTPSRIHNNKKCTRELIHTHMKELAFRSAAHQILFTKIRKLRWLVGFPQTLMSGFLSSALSVNLLTDDHVYHNVSTKVALAMSLTSFILRVTEQYFRLFEKETSHDMSSKLYNTLLRNIQLQYINRRNGISDFDIYTDIVQQMNVIEQYELPISTQLLDSVRANPHYLDLIQINSGVNSLSH